MDWNQHFRSLSDEELEKWIGTNVEPFSPNGELVKLEIQRRVQERILNATRELNQSIDNFSKSSDKYSLKLIKLTNWLVALTVALVFLSIVFLFK